MGRKVSTGAGGGGIKTVSKTNSGAGGKHSIPNSSGSDKTTHVSVSLEGPASKNNSGVTLKAGSKAGNTASRSISNTTSSGPTRSDTHNTSSGGGILPTRKLLD